MLFVGLGAFGNEMQLMLIDDSWRLEQMELPANAG